MKKMLGYALSLMVLAILVSGRGHWDTHQFPADLTRKPPPLELTPHIYMSAAEASGAADRPSGAADSRVCGKPAYGSLK